MTNSKVFAITGPTSGIGRATALALSREGTVVLVGRDRARLDALKTTIERRGGRAHAVTCDLADPGSARRAAADIVALGLPLTALVNNAGIMQTRPTRNALGWDMSFATNHVGPFVLTEALAPHLPDGAHVLFVVSAAEDPERKPAHAAGFRGGRWISATASARGEWQPGGSIKPGMDAYATTKQANLAAALAFARANPRLRVNALEPGVMLTTGLGRDASLAIRILAKMLAPILVPILVRLVRIVSTPERAARIVVGILRAAPPTTGTYYDEHGEPMIGSTLVRDVAFQDRVVAETRALLATAP